LNKSPSGKAGAVHDAATPGVVTVSNDCAALSAADLAAVSLRFVRKTPLTDGFGLGLSIVQDLCAQSGSALDIASPVPGSTRGFRARLILPQLSRHTPH
jgi:two-component system OmpR family sensor kinase